MNLILVALIGYASAASFPETWERCKVPPSLDFKKNDCVERTINNIIKHLGVNGEPSLGMRDLDPFRIKKITIGQTNEAAPVSFRADFTENDLYGLATTKFMLLSGTKLSSAQNWHIEYKFFVKKLYWIGNYKLDGRLLVLPVRGQGKSNFTMDNMEGVASISCQPYIKNGQEYLKTSNNTLKLKIGKVRIHFDNLFNGDKVIGDTVNRALNDNSALFLDDLLPSLDYTFGKEFLKYLKGILEKIPFKDLVLND